MYSDEAIASLIDRIGFGSSHEVSIDTSNAVGTSKRLFSSFHSLVSIHNLYETTEIVDMESVPFNEYLKQLKTDTVYFVLGRILDTHEDYQYEKDYSKLIIERPQIFDDAIGYRIACKSIEQMISTNRRNATVRQAEGVYQALKIELEGLKVDGDVRSVGIKSDLRNAIRKAQKVIFPKRIIIDNAKIW